MTGRRTSVAGVTGEPLEEALAESVAPLVRTGETLALAVGDEDAPMRIDDEDAAGEILDQRVEATSDTRFLRQAAGQAQVRLAKLAVEASNPDFRHVPTYLSRFGLRVWTAGPLAGARE